MGVDFAIVVPCEEGNKDIQFKLKKIVLMFMHKKYNALDNFDKVVTKEKQEIELRKEMDKQKNQR